ncbi:MAG TPA: sugar ABC transporter permease, partial [Thermomicrobiales bacterium]|nr:sugar ABC transporter permease [Thermomicrobiales bacterium]
MSLKAAQPAERSAVRPATRAGVSRLAPEWLLAIPFLAPALAFYAIFLLVPLLGAVALSVTSWSGFNFADIKFVGADNFRALGHDDVFWLSLRHNLIFLVASVVLKTSVALFLAIALDQHLPFSNFFRGVYLMPTVISLVVVGVVFTLVLSPSLGMINPFLKAIGLGQFAGGWLG